MASNVWYCSRPAMTQVRTPWVALAVVLTACLVLPVVVAADGTDQSAASPPPWIHSIVCPVLYTHEVRSPAVLRPFLIGLLVPRFQPPPLQCVHAAQTLSPYPPHE